MVKLAIICLITFLPCHDVLAKQLYKYQDEKGLWHFTDQKPVSVKNVQQEQLTVSAPKKLVQLVNRGSRLHPRFYVVNDYYGPVEIELSVTKQENVSIYPRPVVRLILPARSDTFVMGIKAMRERGWNYQTLLKKVVGDPTAIHHSDFNYGQPTPSGKAYKVSQGFYGKRSHKREESRYAIDITLPEGTPILAVRGGIIMSVDQDFDVGGYEDKYRNKANQVLILHDDGTVGVYAHLLLESIPVSPGQRVKQGQRIGLSGNTGFSSGPHLHFEVQKNSGMRAMSQPFHFSDNITPDTGVWLKGTSEVTGN